MLKEIFEVPTAIKNTTLKFFDSASKIKKNYFKNINKIVLIACGTSYHASLIGEKYLREAGFDASAEIASEFLYNKQIWETQRRSLFIFITQSGETADTISCANLCKKHHAKTICITNVETSSITKICDYTLPVVCGPEIAVASTKAFNAQVSALLLFSQYLKEVRLLKKSCIEKMSKKIIGLSKKIDINVLKHQIEPIIDIVTKSENVLFVGKHYDYVLALESALKLKEITYINSVAYPSGELKHGTISLIDDKSLTFAFITEKRLIDKTLNVVNQIKSRGGKVVIISPYENTLKNCNLDYFIQLPKINEKLYPILAIIPMQLLSYHVCVKLGHNPDKPRNLAKSVTVE